MRAPGLNPSTGKVGAVFGFREENKLTKLGGMSPTLYILSMLPVYGSHRARPHHKAVIKWNISTLHEQIYVNPRTSRPYMTAEPLLPKP